MDEFYPSKQSLLIHFPPIRVSIPQTVVFFCVSIPQSVAPASPRRRGSGWRCAPSRRWMGNRPPRGSPPSMLRPSCRPLSPNPMPTPPTVLFFVRVAYPGIPSNLSHLGIPSCSHEGPRQKYFLDGHRCLRDPPATACHRSRWGSAHPADEGPKAGQFQRRLSSSQFINRHGGMGDSRDN